MSNIELLPCPFCGHSTPEFERLGTGKQSCIVACGNCGCRHESGDEWDDCGKSWNTRAIESLSAQIATLKTVMIAAAEEIASHWQAHCDAEGYGPQNLLRRLEEGIPSEYGYTAGAFAALTAERDALRKALADLYRGYVNTLENGRDRIRMLGGECDDVPRMEESDPHLRAARASLNTTTTRSEP